MFVLQIFCQK